MNYLVLDAMGVLYTARDDVAELLHPFIVEKGGLNNLDRINDIYIKASLGKMTSVEFWKRVGLSPRFEDEYLRRHALNDGLLDFLDHMSRRDVNVWCLSNDVSEWSKKLRRYFKLERYFRGFIISGDAGLRKPDPAIYRLLLKELGTGGIDVVFVDDNERNLDAALKQGIGTVLFNSAGRVNTGSHIGICSFSELQALVEQRL